MPLSWFSSDTSTSTSNSSPAASTSGADSSESTSKPKPCCVCKSEKSARDECMLFSKSDNPADEECRSLVDQYRSCMAGYGFKT